jgi:hypothetical protein
LINQQFEKQFEKIQSDLGIQPEEEYQKELTLFWENYLSPIGFIKTFNKYKNEISKLLH